MRYRHISVDYLRSILFGVEDGLVSTTGAVVGISVGAQDSHLVVLAGLVIIAVEAISMGSGQFLSEQAVLELKEVKSRKGVIGTALLMLASYFLAGLIPVLPFMFLGLFSATVVALLAAFLSLFLLGYFKAKVTGVNTLRSGLEILLIGGMATSIGVVVGVLLKA